MTCDYLCIFEICFVWDSIGLRTSWYLWQWDTMENTNQFSILFVWLANRHRPFLLVFDSERTLRYLHLLWHMYGVLEEISEGAIEWVDYSHTSLAGWCSMKSEALQIDRTGHKNINRGWQLLDHYGASQGTKLMHIFTCMEIQKLTSITSKYYCSRSCTCRWWSKRHFNTYIQYKQTMHI